MQKNSWDREYSDPSFTSLMDRPHKDVVEFFRYLKKEKFFDAYQKKLLDIGCGIGKDMQYAQETLGMDVSGFDSSDVAVQRANEVLGNASARVHDARRTWPYNDAIFDVAIDHMTLHCLDNAGRKMYAKELARVLKPGSFACIKTFSYQGDPNIRKLINKFPASEELSYIHPTLGIVEHVFTEPELHDLFKDHFIFLKLSKDAGYQKWGNQSYKRMYWLAYLQKVG